ncbi:MAG: GNAT family N-acetyltransferase [Pseudomonadales bacterium]|nr:GNAT family N-acetyltransferase [Pseudomonadales bacterium]
MEIEIKRADYTLPQHQTDIIFLLNSYALDQMGGGKPLSSFVQKNLVAELAARPYAFSILCYVDGKPAGLANCLEGFSSFACKPLINIHDLAVLNEYRSMGLSQRILKEIESIAVSKGCCKITLEVLEGNTTAKGAYRKFGFSGYQLDPKMGDAVFWTKGL